jgi:hypothetical protein
MMKMMMIRYEAGRNCKGGGGSLPPAILFLYLLIESRARPVSEAKRSEGSEADFTLDSTLIGTMKAGARFTLPVNRQLFIGGVDGPWAKPSDQGGNFEVLTC